MRTTLSTLLLLSALLLAGCAAGKPEGTITVDGSDTVYPLSKAMADAFHQANPGVQVNVAFSGTGGGFRKFCAGQGDIEDASRPIKAAEAAECLKQHVEYIELAMAFDSLSVVVNPENNFVKCLTVQELKAIWEPSAEGTINNWHQIRASFPERPLTLFGPGTDNGTFDYFTAAIVGTEASSRSDYGKSTDYTVIEHDVAADPNALGYFGYAYYQANQSQLKLIAIDSGRGCITPSAQSVADRTYHPLSRPLLLYINKAAASRAAIKAFVHFYLSPQSATYVEKVGYVPLPAGSLLAQTQRFDEGVTGSGLGGHGSVLGVNLDWSNPEDQEKAKNQLVQ